MSDLSLGIIIFDLDGTLVDAMPAQKRAFGNALFVHHQVAAARSEAAYLATAGQPLDVQFVKAARLAGVVLTEDQTKQLIDEFWISANAHEPSAFPHAPELIKRLDVAGYKLVVSTGSTPGVAINKLAKLGVRDCFELVLGTDYDGGSIRKGPRHLEEIQKHFGVSQRHLEQNCIFVGDGVHDMELASSGGFRSIGITSSLGADALRNAGASAVISELNELNAIVCPSGRFLRISEVAL